MAEQENKRAREQENTKYENDGKERRQSFEIRRGGVQDRLGLRSQVLQHVSCSHLCCLSPLPPPSCRFLLSAWMVSSSRMVVVNGEEKVLTKRPPDVHTIV